MTSAVIDVSVIGSWFLPDESQGKYGSILNNIDKIKIHVPSIFQYEFINFLLNVQKKKRIYQSRTMAALEIVCKYPISLEPPTVDLKENIHIFELAKMHELTAYDTAYLELAIRLNLPLITYDTLLLNTAKKLKLQTSLN